MQVTVWYNVLSDACDVPEIAAVSGPRAVHSDNARLSHCTAIANMAVHIYLCYVNKDMYGRNILVMQYSCSTALLSKTFSIIQTKLQISHK